MPPISLLSCHRVRGTLGRQAVHASRSLLGWCAQDGGWAAGASKSRLRRLEMDAHPRLRYWSFFGLGGSRVFPVATCQTKKSSLLRREHFSEGCFSRKLLAQCASPHLAPLALCLEVALMVLDIHQRTIQVTHSHLPPNLRVASRMDPSIAAEGQALACDHSHS